jgi:hypothetical protein
MENLEKSEVIKTLGNLSGEILIGKNIPKKFLDMIGIEFKEMLVLDPDDERYHQIWVDLLDEINAKLYKKYAKIIYINDNGNLEIGRAK